MRNCVVFFNIFIFFSSFCLLSFAQDERFIRKMLSGELAALDGPKNRRDYIWQVDSPVYLYDINSDGLLEGIEYSKREGEDWLILYESNYQKVFEKKFPKIGNKSRLYKIRVSKLSKDTSLLVLYFYEGLIRYIDTQDAVRVFFLTFDKNDFSTLTMTEGPRIMERLNTSRQHKHGRTYSLEILDLDNDGVKEILVQYRGVNRVYSYLGEGKWKEN